MRPRPPRSSLFAPIAVALALHSAVAFALFGLPRHQLAPAEDPRAIDLLVLAPAVPQQEALLVGGVALQEATPGPVAWPEASISPAPPAASRPVAVLRRAMPDSAAPPAAAAHATPAAAQGTQASPDEIAAWKASLSAWVEKHRRYPPAARFRQEEGVVQVRFELGPSGRVQHVALATGSGFAALDQAALALLVDAELPPPPPAMNPALRSVSLAIRYRLD